MTRVLVITGGSNGIGARTARLAARDGWDVVVGYRSDEAAANAVVTDCRAAGTQAIAARVDVALETEVEEFFRGAEELGPVQGLVNNAGITAPASRFADLTEDRVRRIFDVNVFGAFHCAKAAIRRMKPGGAIVNVSSRAAALGSPGEYIDYAASKAAVDTMTIGLAKEVAADGIRVNAVRPGLIETRIHEPGRLERLAPTVPMGRSGTPDEIAEAVVWLLSDAASYVTGAILDVSGGR